MCLYSKERIPRIADKDIVCYKIVSYANRDYCITPYTNVILSLNKKITAILDNSYPSADLIIYYCVGSGFFHAYYNERYAQLMLINLETVSKKPYKILRSIIPKGSKYYIGNEYDICGDKIIIKSEPDNLDSDLKIINKLKAMYLKYKFKSDEY